MLRLVIWSVLTDTLVLIKVSLFCFLHYSTRAPDCTFKLAFINKVTVDLPLVLAAILTTTQALLSGSKVRALMPGDIWLANAYQSTILALAISAGASARLSIWLAAWTLPSKLDFPPKIKSAITATIWLCLTLISAKFVVAICALALHKLSAYWASGVFDGLSILVDIILWVIIAISYSRLHNYVPLSGLAMVL